MSGKINQKRRHSMAVLSVCSTLVLAGCDENGEFQMPFGNAGGEEPSAVAAATSPTVTLVERDVEAPDVFSVTDNGLWDGRPSLGGVWVAHPDVTDPERVIIRNLSNNEFVIGALFRRERENPGPSLQVSSDAAEALGLLAGAPTQLSVIALRREEAPEEPDPVELAETEVLAAPPSVEATALDADVEPAAVETAAIEPASDAAGDPITSAAAIAIAAAEAASAAPTPAPAPAPAPAPVAASSLDKPYIQIGIFSVEANANRTADRLKADGLLPTVLAQESQGRKFWRVIVGPAPTASDRASVLEKAKALGFTDAYFVTN